MKTFIQFAQVVLTLIVSALCLTNSTFGAPSVTTVSHNNAPVRVPFVYDPLLERDIVVQVRIGKHRPMPFLVDTGASVAIVLDKWAARELNLPSDGPSITLNPGNNIGYTVPPQDIALDGIGVGGDWTSRHITIYVADMNLRTTLMGRKAGIIGLPLLKAANLQIDFPRRQLLFLPLANSPAVPPGAIGIALRPDADPALYDAILPANPGYDAILPANPGSLAPSGGLPLLLDTGSDSCLLPAYFIPDLHPVVATLGGQFTLAGSGTVANYFIPLLKFGPITAKNVLVGEASSTRALLGLDVLSRFVVTLDWAGQRMWLTPNHTPAPAIPGATDVQLTEVNAHILVDQVASGSPAAQAGLRPEQRVLRVDGRDTNGVYGAEVELALNGYADTTAKVTVEDDMGRHDIVFSRRSLADPSAYAGIGLCLVHAERAHTGWYVQSLLYASRAYRHGIRPGDFITAVGKTNIEAMPLPTVEQLLRGAAVGTKVTVQRPVTVPLPTITSTTFPLPDLSKLSPTVRREIEDLLKQGYTATKNAHGGFTMTPPSDSDKPAVNNGGMNGNDVDTQGKSGSH